MYTPMKFGRSLLKCFNARTFSIVFVFLILFSSISPLLAVSAHAEDIQDQDSTQTQEITDVTETPAVAKVEESKPEEEKVVAEEDKTVGDKVDDVTDTAVENVDAKVQDEEKVASEQDQQNQNDQQTQKDQIESPAISGEKITYSNIKVNTTYTYVNDSKVNIRFSKLPVGSHFLSIEKVNTEYGVGYEFLSDMTDGTFKYDLTLPNTLGNKNVDVKYSEDNTTFKDVKNKINITNDLVKVLSLNHFTLFIITDDAAAYSGTWTDYATQGYLDTGVHYPTELTAGRKAIWTFNTLTPGLHAVYLSWSTDPNRTQAATYTLYHANGITNIVIDQEKLADQTTVGASGQWSGWYYAGYYELNGASRLELTSNENSSGSEYVIADEVGLLDVTIPELTTPANNSYVNMSAGTFLDWTDATGTGSITYDYQVFSDAGYTSMIYSQTGISASELSSGPTADGVYYLRVRANDGSFNTEWSNGAGNAYRITVDNTAPTLQFTDDVSASTTLTDDIAFDLLTETNPDTASLAYAFVNSPADCNSGMSFTNGNSFSISDEAHNGQYICIKGSDLAGNTTYLASTEVLKVDITGPGFDPITVIMDLPGSFPFTDGNHFSFFAKIQTDVSGIDTSSCKYTIDNGANWITGTFYTDLSGEYCYVSGLSVADNTTLDMSVRIKDLLGNTGTAAFVQRIADSELPVVNSLTVNPTSGVFTSANPTFTALISDSVSPITSCEYSYQVNGGAWSAWTSGTLVLNADPRSAICTTTLSSLNDDDVVNIKFRAADSIYQRELDPMIGLVNVYSAEESLSATVDSEIPSTVFTAPMVNNSKWKAPGINITGQSTDTNGSRVVTTNLYYRVSGTTTWIALTDLDNTGNSEPFSWSYLWTPAEGLYDFMARSVDAVGNIESTAYVYGVVYDVTAPNVPTQLSPANGSYRNRSGLVFDWSDETDLNGPVTYNYQRTSSFGSFGPVSTGTTSQINGFSLLSNVYQWQVQACDSLGNCSAWSPLWTVTVDNINPFIRFNDNVAIGPVQSDVINISVTDINPDTTTYLYAFTNGACDSSVTFPVGQTYTSGVDFVIATEDHNGLYICVKATDLAGNTTYQLSRRDLNIDITPPETRFDADAKTGIDSANPFFYPYDLSMDENDVFSAVYTPTGENIDGWRDLGWYRRFQSIDLSLANGNPSDRIYYRWVGAADPCPEYTGYNLFFGDIAGGMNSYQGERKLCYYGVDRAGNYESIHSIVLRRDGIDPDVHVIGIDGQSYSPWTWYYTNADSINVNFEANDSTSGLARGQFIVYNSMFCGIGGSTSLMLDDGLYPSGSWHNYGQAMDLSSLADGRHCASIQVRDEAGNLTTRNFILVNDRVAPTIDTIPDQTFNEGDMVNLGILNGKNVSDETGLDRAYLRVTFTDQYGNSYTLYNISFDISGTGWDGLGGTLNELYEYITGDAIDFSDITLPVDTSVIDEGVYTFNYYVRDLAGNRSDCDVEAEGDQNCNFSVTINNVLPEVDFKANGSANAVTINEGDAIDFSALFADPSYVNINDPESFLDGYVNNPDDANWGVWFDNGLGSGYQYLGTMGLPGNIETVFGDLVSTYANEGTYMARLVVCESMDEEELNTTGKVKPQETGVDGSCTEKTITITVNNVVPTVKIAANPGTTVNKGTAVKLTANPTSGNAPLTYLWGGDCSGTAGTFTLPTAVGVYNCSVTVTDADGDSSSDTIKVTVKQPATITAGLGDVNGENTTAEDTDKNGEVLGATCDKQSKMSGLVFFDKNNNDKKDDGEDGQKDVEVKVYATVDGEKKLIVTVKTDANGYWYTDICPGNYTVEINKDNLPDDTKVDGESVLSVNVSSDNETTNVNFDLSETDGGSWFHWWYICLSLLLLLALATGGFILATRENEERKK